MSYSLFPLFIYIIKNRIENSIRLIIFLYYDKDKNIKKGKIIVPRESSFEIKELLEDLFLEKIPI